MSIKKYIDINGLSRFKTNLVNLISAIAVASSNGSGGSAGMMSATDKEKLDEITNKSAVSGGTATSLCTTGEKYTWNNKAEFSHSHKTILNSSSVNLLASTNTNRELNLGSNIDLADYEAIEIRYLQYGNGSTNYYATLRVANTGASGYGVVPAVRYSGTSGSLSTYICRISLSGNKITLADTGGLPSNASFYVSTVIGYK